MPGSKRIAERKAAIGKRHDAIWAQVAGAGAQGLGRLADHVPAARAEIWDVIKDEDWVLTANKLKHQVRKLWDFDRPYRHPGRELGTATQIGMSLGVALAHKGTGRIRSDPRRSADRGRCHPRRRSRGPASSGWRTRSRSRSRCRPRPGSRSLDPSSRGRRVRCRARRRTPACGLRSRPTRPLGTPATTRGRTAPGAAS